MLSLHGYFLSSNFKNWALVVRNASIKSVLILGAPLELVGVLIAVKAIPCDHW